ncbi:soluble lytic murein transglycosylase-like protein [Pseudorhizobium tarimense]|uniref:Soluble lytic murein transglycosylase-like protein n=1 Tax=Pseudorhizobium tarimense TaxID=1079109 RepID=A0ABV2H3X7_9HYPH|nr:lytic transglycosylase domain-containing protein [Pseudorhizobium tarimense]MCJ8518435.1 lytic transglycosylase domain-containing protein [Pseudorhizobium tarimense]
MAMNRFLSRTALVSLAFTSALAGCSSVEPAAKKTARLQQAPGTTEQAAVVDGAASEGASAANATVLAAAPAETTGTSAMTLTKTGRIQLAIPDTTSVAVAQNAAMALPEMAPQVAYATTDPVSATRAAAAITSVTEPAPVDGETETASIPTAQLRAEALAPDEDELTPDMQALQSVIPIPRPDLKAMAYATPEAPAAVATLQSVDTRNQFPPAPGDPLPATAAEAPADLAKLIKRYAGLYGVPESLVHRVVHRESRYNPKAYHKNGYWGLMQIKYATAKSMGYDGPPEGLLDAETNLKYAIKYLRGAWLVADNSNDNAIRLYARGYYYDAKRKGMLHVLQQ